jgi:hypothetical protein
MRIYNPPIAVLLFIFLLLDFTFAQTEVEIPAFKDNTIYETFESDDGPLSNGMGVHFFAGVNGNQGGNRILRGLIHFDLQDYIPADAIISEASLVLSMNQTNSGVQTVSIYPLLRDWGEGASDAPQGEAGGTSALDNDATWLHTFYEINNPDNPNSLWTNNGGDFNAEASASIEVNLEGVYTWGSTEAMVNDVQNWLDNPQENFGWIIRGDESGEVTAKRFISKDDPEGSNPQLLISYTIPNDPPVAVNDTTETNEDEFIEFSVLANDFDPDGNIDLSSLNVVTGPENGVLSNIIRGFVRYTPDTNFFGTDIFTYNVQDNNGEISNTAQVIITVHPVNDSPVANNDIALTNEDVSVIINILSNDLDDHGLNVSSVTLTEGPFNGTITAINPTTGAVSYSPDNNYNGNDSFSYTVDDDSMVTSNIATVAIQIASVNDTPNAVNDPGIGVNEDGSVLINILANDNDIDGTLISSTVNITTNPTNGNAMINELTGAVTYEPDDNYFGNDSFSYTVEDNNGETSNIAIVTINIHSVNDAPFAGNNQVNILENTPVTINVVNNDIDIDGNLVFSSIAIISNPVHGNVTNINSQNGHITYDPDEGYNGNDSFSYTIEDDSGAVSNIATVNISVGSVNDFPVTEADQAVTNEDNSVIINILINDEDPDGVLIPSSVTIVTQPGNGIITNINSASGAVTYQPNTNYFGMDNFIYTVADDSGAVSEETNVTITIFAVNDPPVANDDIVNTDEEVMIAIQILNNDSDVDENIDPQTVLIINNPVNGLINSIINGVVNYTPGINFTGSDSFTYTVEDDSGAVSNEASVSININEINDPPQISELPGVSLNEDDSLLVTNEIWVDYITDPDTPDSLLILSFSQGNHVFVNQNNEQIIFNLTADFYGHDSLWFYVSDGEFIDSAKIYFTVFSINDFPFFTDFPQEIVFENTESFILDLSGVANDNDLPYDSLRWSFIANENLQINHNTNTNNLTITAPDFNGSVFLHMFVSDDSSAKIHDSVLVNVTGSVTALSNSNELIPAIFDISQNYPNPFNPVTNIDYQLPKTSRVIIEVFNIRGQKVFELVKGVKSAGIYTINFNGHALSSGIYFYRIEAEGFTKIKRMLLLR